MARTSGFVIVLSGEERAELERRVACYSLPHKVVVRAKMILYAAEGESNTEIARRLETAPRVVGVGGSASSRSGWPGSRIANAWAARAVFPPEQVAEVKALACELPATQGLPLSRFSRAELHRLVVQRGLSDASASTIWRWLHDDALKPWQQRSWIFVRDPHFAEKAGRVLDLYQRRFEGRWLRPDEYVICADEKSQPQALGRTHATLPPAPGRATRFEFEYERNGTVAYLAGWDVHHANLFDRVEAKTGIKPFGRLVDDVMTVEPYASARTVYWIVDNGSSHAGQASIDRLEGAHNNLRLIHLPIHASWLNQIELYFSIVQRKALTPNDFESLDALSERLLRFGDHYRQIAQPSNGPSAAPTSTIYSPRSTLTSPSSPSRHEDRTCGHVY